ncbi:MAG: hypothetical protein FGM57_03205 [Candidatus Taylorbacteria bacterium]|nr:hypothetical protein [Candidatus Taylorbacteria bacterium]
MVDDNLKQKFSFPNSDRYTANQKEQESELQRPRPVVHITDALNIEKKDDGDARTIRTFQADIADAIKNDNVSMIKVALAEKKRQETRGNFDSTLETKKNDTVFYMASIGVAIVVVIGFILFVAFGTSPDAQQPSAPGQTNTSQLIIYTEFSTVIDTNNRDANDIERLVTRIKDEKFDLGAMKEIVLTKGAGAETQKITTEDFFELIGARASDSLVRALDSNFLMGTYSFSSPYDTYLIFKVNSYDNAFAGMLNWENSMDVNIGGMIITKRLIVPSQTQPATTTASTTEPAVRKRMFVDKVLQNKDSRALIDERGSVLMLYTFVDKNTLVIASSDKSLKEILFRLTTGRIIR